jgi:hypothetical protein
LITEKKSEKRRLDLPSHGHHERHERGRIALKNEHEKTSH